MRCNQVIRGNPRWMAAVAGILLAVAVPVLASAAPPTSAPASNDPTQLHSRLDDMNAKIATARSTNSRLESQVATLEQKNEASRAQLKQRDAEIANLRAKLQAAGAPASASSP